MKIAMIGSGYVGLVSGACFADFGHDVVCVDKDESKIASLHDNIMPIYEPGLANLVERNVAEGRLTFSTDLSTSVKGCDAVFIAVGTPSRRGDGHADLTYVFAASAEIAEAIDDRTIVVTKSTVPVGTGDEVERIIREIRPQLDFAVVSNPEFLREGAAIGDFKRPDRIVVGTDVAWARDVMHAIYRPLFLNESPILFTSRRSSELIKYAANAFLATKITFINEMADLCETLGANVQDISRGIGLDNRIGPKFLHAGPGYGGSCFPKDTLALLKTAQDNDVPVRIVAAVVEANAQRKRAMGHKIIKALGSDPKGKKIALLGLTFKPNTDDMRDAPSIDIVKTLLDAGAEITAFDPEGMQEAGKEMPNIKMSANAYDAATGADAVAIITEWDTFRALDLKKLRLAMAGDALIDLRNIYNPVDAGNAGFRYTSVGR
jgi:UDPglucose 6-dehydrogenase